MNPYIVIVHQHNHLCKLLVIYDQDEMYYSMEKSYRELKYFKKPFIIDQEYIHSQNNRNILKLTRL